MSRTYRKMKGRNAHQKYFDYFEELCDIDEDHRKLHGGYKTTITYNSNQDNKIISYTYFNLCYSGAKYIPLSGKALKKRKSELHRDGVFTYRIGRYYKHAKWVSYRHYYRKNIHQWIKDNDHEIVELPNPDSSWEAW